MKTLNRLRTRWAVRRIRRRREFWATMTYTRANEIAGAIAFESMVAAGRWMDRYRAMRKFGGCR